nr:hypothetical protein [Tanacetum cinerariifolium]
MNMEQYLAHTDYALWEKNGRKLEFNGKEPIGFDKTKVKCYNYHRRGHFARDCRSARNSRNKSRDVGNAGYKGRDNGKRHAKEEGENELVVQDRLGYDSQFHEKEMLDIIEEEVTETVFDNRSSDEENSLANDRLDDSIYKFKISETVTSFSKDHKDAPETSTGNVEKPKEDRSSAPFIQDWKTDNDNDSIFRLEPIPAKINFVKADKMAKKSVLPTNVGKGTGHRERRLVWNSVQRINDQNKFASTSVFTRSGRIPVSAAKPKAAASTSAAKPVNTAGPKQSVNFSKSRKAVSAIKGNKVNVVKTSAGCVWRPRVNDIDQLSKDNRWICTRVDYGHPQQALKNKEIVNSRCSGHMTGNKAYVTDYQEINDGGFVAFGSSRVSVGNQTDKNAGPQDTNGNADDKATDDKPTDDIGSKIIEEPVNKEDQTYRDELDELMSQEKEVSDAADALRQEFEQGCIDQRGVTNSGSTNSFNTISHSVNVASTSVTFSANGPSSPHLDAFIPANTLLHVDQDDSQIPNLEDIAKLHITGIFNSAYDDDLDIFNSLVQSVGAEADFNSLKSSTIVSPIPTHRVHLDHPKDQIIGDPKSAVQTKGMEKKSSEAHALIPDEFYEGAYVLLKTAASTPIETQKSLVKDEEAADVDVHLYRSMIGSLMYLTASRPDIMFAVCACSRFQVTPKLTHLHAVKRIFRRLISWQWKKQTFVATSTTEAEYVTTANCCRQNTATSKTVNSVKQIHVIVDGKAVVISESLVRSDLLFNDEDGKVTSLFDSMLVQHQAPEGEGSAIAPEPQPTPSTSQPNISELQTVPLQTKTHPTISHEPHTETHIEQILPSSFTYQRKHKKNHKHKKAKKVTELPQTSVPLDHEADEAVHEEGSYDLPLLEVNTSGSGEDNIEHQDDLTDVVPPTPHDSPLSRGHIPGSDKGRPNLLELMNICTYLSNKVLALEETKNTQDKVITRLKWRVRRLEKKRKTRTLQPIKRRLFKGRVKTFIDNSLGEDASKQERNDDKTKELNLTDGADIKMLVKDKGGGEKGGSTADQILPLLRLRSEKAKEKGVAFRDVEEPLRLTRSTTTLQPLLTSDPKDKGKGVLVEEEPEKLEKVGIKARMDADHELVVRMTHEEQEKYTIKERVRLLAEYFEMRKNQLAAEKAEVIRNKPPTRTQVKNMMITYLKHMGRKKSVEPESKGKKGKRIKRFADSTLKHKSSKKKKMMQEQESKKSDEKESADYEHEKEELRMWLTVVSD